MRMEHAHSKQKIKISPARKRTIDSLKLGVRIGQVPLPHLPRT